MHIFKWVVKKQEVYDKLRAGFDDRMEAVLREYGQCTVTHTQEPYLDAVETRLACEEPEVIYAVIDLFKEFGVPITVECIDNPLKAARRQLLREKKYRPS